MIKIFNKRTKNQKGFTLIELIVVIAIIGILGAIAVPKFGGFRETAAMKADAATGDVIRNAVMIALTNGDIPTAEQKISWDSTSDGSYNTILQKLLGDTAPLPQQTSKTGFEITIDANGNVEVEVTP